MKLSNYIFVRSEQPENIYGRFTGEIIKTEGFNSFEIVDLDSAKMPDLLPDDLIILTRCFLRQKEKELIMEAVKNGLNMIVFQPSISLAEHFGLILRGTVVYPGWAGIRAGFPGSGAPLQTHVPIAEYEAEESLSLKILADAYSSDWDKKDSPAVVKIKSGKGSVVFFFYDLPAAVARIRFGNIDLASFVTTGAFNWQHAADLFSGYVDKRMLHLPQADLHGQFLGSVITDISRYPMPRIWYYERASQKTAAVFSSDGDMSKPEAFEALADCVEKNNGTISFYLMKDSLLSRDHVNGLRSRGHTFAPHVDPRNVNDECYFAFPDLIKSETELFKNKFGEPGYSIQCHRAPWQGYMNWIESFVENDFRLLMAYVSYPTEMLNKFMCGSSRPIKFTAANGFVHDCWQQPVMTYDDATLINKMTKKYKEIIDEFKQLFEDSLNTHHSPISMASHPLSYVGYSKKFFDTCLKLLYKNNVSVYSGDQWCDIQDRRHAIVIQQQKPSANTINYDIKNLIGCFTLMIPVKKTNFTVKVNKKNTVTIKQYILQRDYCFVELENNNNESLNVQIEFS